MEALASIGQYATPAAIGTLSIAAGMTPQTAAVMSIATYAIENTPRVAAGPLAYASCVALCGTLLPPLAAACILKCLPFLAAPTP